MYSFAVVEFIEEKSVEVVAKMWIETCDGASDYLSIQIYYCNNSTLTLSS